MEDLNNIEEELNRLGVKTRTLFKKNWLSTKRIVTSISKMWKSFSKDDQDNLCRLFAGSGKILEQSK